MGIRNFLVESTNIAQQLILDWYHLEKKCKEQLSIGMKGRDVRNYELV